MITCGRHVRCPLMPVAMGQVLSCVKQTMTLLVCGSTTKALPAKRNSRSTGYRRLATTAQTFVPGDE